MNVSRAAFFTLCFLAPGFAHAKLHLLLDERLKKSRIEQTIYKFVPLTNANEVELNYVSGFLKDGAWRAAAAKLKSERKAGAGPADSVNDDRAMYIGADEWPRDAYINEAAQGKDWDNAFGKISFFVEADVPEYARLPRSVFPRREFWKKYAALIATKYEGYLSTHYLDTRPNQLQGSEWRNFTCVHESGREIKPGRNSPLSIVKNQYQLNFRSFKQLEFIGHLICINTPKADAIFEVHTAKTDVVMEADPGRFSIWNEAQPLHIRITSARQIFAPLSLHIVPEVNEAQTEFFFQGERITCTSNRCRKKDARFLLPQFRDTAERLELAIRAPGDSYFRGTLRLMAGEIEVARTDVRFTPQSWVAETSYALKNPSEYKSAFFIILALVMAGAGMLVLLWQGIRRLAARRAERGEVKLPRQSSATVAIQRSVTYRMTAGENPFGCELLDFGGIVALRVEGESVAIQHGGKEHVLSLHNFCYTLPDGYVLAIKIADSGEMLLEAYCLSLAEPRLQTT